MHISLIICWLLFNPWEEEEGNKTSICWLGCCPTAGRVKMVVRSLSIVGRYPPSSWGSWCDHDGWNHLQWTWFFLRFPKKVILVVLSEKCLSGISKLPQGSGINYCSTQTKPSPTLLLLNSAQIKPHSTIAQLSPNLVSLYYCSTQPTPSPAFSIAQLSPGQAHSINATFNFT